MSPEKQLMISLYYDARRELILMKKSQMSLSDRIKYEVALAKLDTLRQLIEKLVE